MAGEYRLTLDAFRPAGEMLALASPELAGRATGDASEGPLGVDLGDTLGVQVLAARGRHGYLDVEWDDGSESRALERFTTLYVDLDPDADVDGTKTLLHWTHRVLAATTEDAFLILDGDYLLLSRRDGEVRSHRASWWAAHDPDGTALDALSPGADGT